MPVNGVPARHLLLTETGERWLRNFDEVDRPAARELIAALSLVSHNEFERGLTELILGTARASAGTVALYGAREVPGGLDLEPKEGESSGVVDATPRGSDIGSEGRVASLIRGLCRQQSQKLLNHPTLDVLRKQRVDVIVVIDDFIGSGQRCCDYLDAIWKYLSVKSWASYKKIAFVVLAYTATADGLRRVRTHSSRPSAELHRHCPTIKSLSWEKARIDRIRGLCERYAAREKLSGPPLGYKGTGALLVFEHGCPNNAPAVLWAKARGSAAWQPLFPARAVDASVVTAFPPEIARRDPVHSLIQAGQQRIADALGHVIERPLPAEMIVALTLISRGRRRKESIGDAAGLTARETERLLEQCVAAGLVTPLLRITQRGLTELQGIRSASGAVQAVDLPIGHDEYYPVALRSRLGG